MKIPLNTANKDHYLFEYGRTAGKKYQLDIKRLPIHKTPHIDTTQVGYMDFTGSVLPVQDKIIGMKEEIHIVEVEAEERPRKPWTSFSYIPKDSPWKLPGSMEYSSEG